MSSDDKPTLEGVSASALPTPELPSPTDAAPKKKKKIKKKDPAEGFVPQERKLGRPKYELDQLQVFDYVKEATKKNVWYYRDRMSVPRGPCSLPVLRECWVNGVIDENTIVWGQGLIDWLPIRNVRTLVPQIRTFEVQVATWVKKNFALKPALKDVRRRRAEFRTQSSDQVNDMY